jgi:hypothetical protein
MKAKKRSGRQVAKENAEDESDDLMDVKPLEAFATGKPHFHTDHHDRKADQSIFF